MSIIITLYMIIIVYIFTHMISSYMGVRTPPWGWLRRYGFSLYAQYPKTIDLYLFEVML